MFILLSLFVSLHVGERAVAKTAEEDVPSVISSLPDSFPFVFSILQKGVIAH
ncbi:MAG: hypothetical protein J2P37_26675 [Ktedonobacteraceae bacterium]|nr:hypothetical protein [Ktedonobacteraceae bacterium]MBO0793114.1 hypothetical protein [Ktedonobacteraceae bacterium]